MKKIKTKAIDSPSNELENFNYWWVHEKAKMNNKKYSSKQIAIKKRFDFGEDDE